MQPSRSVETDRALTQHPAPTHAPVVTPPRGTLTFGATDPARCRAAVTQPAVMSLQRVRDQQSRYGEDMPTPVHPSDHRDERINEFIGDTDATVQLKDNHLITSLATVLPNSRMAATSWTRSASRLTSCASTSAAGVVVSSQSRCSSQEHQPKTSLQRRSVRIRAEGAVGAHRTEPHATAISRSFMCQDVSELGFDASTTDPDVRASTSLLGAVRVCCS